MLGIAHLATSILLGAGPDPGAIVSVDLGVRSEARTRTYVIENQQAQSFLDMDVVPRAGLTVDRRRLKLELVYDPHLLWVDATHYATPDYLHHASAAVNWQMDHHWRLLSAGTISYGTTSFLALPQTVTSGGQPFQVVPTLSKVLYGHADASAALEGILAPGTRSTVSLAWSVDGGADGTAQKTYPLVREVRGTGGVDWDLTRSGVLGTRLTATYSEGGDRRAIVAGATANWRERMDGENVWWLAAGVSAYHDEGSGISSSNGALPLGELGFQHTSLIHSTEEMQLRALAARGAERYISESQRQMQAESQRQMEAESQAQGQGQVRGEGSGPVQGPRPAQAQVPSRPRPDERTFLQESVVFGAAPLFDRFAGQIYEQLQLTSSVAWAPTQRWKFEGSVMAGIMPRSGATPASMGTLEMRATWTSGKLQLYGGIRGLVQKDDRILNVQIKQWGLFLGVGFDHVERL